MVQEMGKSRAAAFALGILDIDEGAHDNLDSHDSDLENPYAEGNSSVFSLLLISCIIIHFVLQRINDCKF